MGYEFKFNKTIERGPICLEVEVTCEYTPAGQFLPAEVEYLNYEWSDDDRDALGSHYKATYDWIEKETFHDGQTILESFHAEALIEARKQGFDKYDEEEASRFSGFDRVACGYR